MRIPFTSDKIKTLQSQLKSLENKLEEQIDEFADYYDKSAFLPTDQNPLGDISLTSEIFDKITLQKMFCTETWFYIAVSTIAETIASLPFKIEKRKMIKQDIMLPDGSTECIHKEIWVDAGAEPESLLFKFPNEIQTTYDFWYTVIVDLLSTGDSYIYAHKTDMLPLSSSEERLRNAISRVRKTDVDSLFRINSACVDIEKGTDGNFIDQYVVMSDSTKINFEPEDIVHIRMPNVSDPYYGLSPIIPVFRKVLLDKFTDEHHLRFYKQGARLGGVIETNKKITKEQMQRLTTTFEAKFSNKSKHYKTLILPEGMKYNPIEVSPVEQALIEFSKNNKEPILAVFKVPPIKIGLLDGATYSNALIQNKTFYENAIKPITTILEQGINQSETILTSSRNLRFKFDLNQVEALQEDYKAKAESGKEMLLSGLTFNEVRERVWGVGPLEGGDKTPAMKPDVSSSFPFMLSALPVDNRKNETTNVQNDTLAISDIVPTRTTFEARVAQLINQAINEGIDIGIATERAIRQTLDEGYSTENKDIKAQAPFSKENLQRYSKALAGEDTDKMIKEREKEVYEFFKRMKSFVLSKVKNVAVKKDLSFDVKITIPSQMDFKVWISEETDRIVKSMINATKYGYKFNIPTETISFPNEDALKVLKKIATRNVKSVVSSSLGTLKGIITASVAEQVSVNEIRSRIEDAFDNMSTSRAGTIARTETLVGVSVGQDLKKNEFKKLFPSKASKLKRIWITARDEKVRESHIEQDGMVIEVDKEFPNGLKFPRDPNGSAEEVINCRCTFLDFLPEDTDSIFDILNEPSDLVD